MPAETIPESLRPVIAFSLVGEIPDWSHILRAKDGISGTDGMAVVSDEQNSGDLVMIAKASFGAPPRWPSPAAARRTLCVPQARSPHCSKTFSRVVVTWRCLISDFH